MRRPKLAVEELSDENFESSLKDAPVAVVDFYAGWCGPCMLFKPKFKRLSGEYEEVQFFICDGEKAPESRKTVEIPTLPYFVIYRHGEFVAGFSTAKEEGFRKQLASHLGELAK